MNAAEPGSDAHHPLQIGGCLSFISRQGTSGRRQRQRQGEGQRRRRYEPGNSRRDA